MAIDFSNFTNLTPGQRTTLQSYVDFATQLNAARDDLATAPTPTQTYAQAKAVDVACREIMTFVGKAQRAAQYVMQFHRDNAVKALDG